MRYVKLTVLGAADYDGPWTSINEFEVICSGDTSNKFLLEDAVKTTIYPNPIESTTTISGAANSTVRIYDMVGRIILSQNISTDSEQIDLSGLPQGIY